MARKSTKTQQVDTSVVKALDPRDPDTKYMGDEPLFVTQPSTETRKISLIKGFNWYSRFYGRKDAKELICQFLDLTNKIEKAKMFRKVDEKEITITTAWLARMSLRGLVLTEEESTRITTEIEKLINPLTVKEVRVSTTGGVKQEKKEVNKLNVQEIMRERASEAAGDLEGVFDDYIKAGAKASHSFRPIDYVAKRNVLPQHISIIVDVWKKKQTEFDEVMKGKDAQLVQAYGHFTRTQIKNIYKFIEQVLTDLNGYVNVKKAAKAPRKRKAVPVEKQVAKMKFLKEFKDTATKLDLVSLHPVKLHGASECYLYDTAKRKLIYMVADEYSKTFSVKGTTLLGFDNSKSQTKTLRKPAEQLAQILKLGKPAGRKYFSEIRAVATTPNGRTNDDMIILKAW